MCEIDTDGDRATVWSETLVGKARKEHRCDMCGGKIAAGTSYQRHFSIFDGYANDEARCLPCETITCAFQREHHIRYSPDGMRELIVECLQVSQIYDDATDTYTPLGDSALRWHYALIEMDARREAAR